MQEKRKEALKTNTDHFGHFAAVAASYLGSRWAFAGAIGVIFLWAATGPLYHYSDTWQLIINTGTTIVTFLMVFLIQNTQNRDARAMNLKLDELICSIDAAKNQMINIEHLSDSELDDLTNRYEQVRSQAMRRLGNKAVDEVDDDVEEKISQRSK